MTMLGTLLAATVVIKGFTPITEPMVLTERDSGTVYCGEGPDAVIAGGEYLSGWTVLADGTWECAAPRDASGKLIWFDQLWVNGRRAAFSPWPKTGGIGFAFAEQRPLPSVAGLLAYENAFRLSAAAPNADYAAEDWPHALVMIRNKWNCARYYLSAYDPATGNLTCAVGRKWPAWNPWCDNTYPPDANFENVRFGFTAPGDWFYDYRAAKLRYRPLPGETPSTARVFAPTRNLDSLLIIRGAHDVTVENLAFEGTASENRFGATDGRHGFDPYQAAIRAPGAIQLERARQVTIRNCRVSKTGGYAVRIGDGSMSNLISHCEFFDLGAGGVAAGAREHNPEHWMGDPRISPRDDSLPCPVVHDYSSNAVAFIEVSDCRIRDYGRVNREGVGVLFTDISDSKVLHNEIDHGFYSGVSVGWVWGYRGSVSQRNEIAFNRIHDLGGRVMSDLAGVYLLGTAHGTTVHDNCIFNIFAKHYGGWGLYADEGSEGVVLENNLVYDTFDGGFHQHYGRNNVVRNNVFAFSERDQLAITSGENHLSVAFLNNIIYWDRNDNGNDHAFLRYEGLANAKAKAIFLGNVWWNAGAPTYLRKWFGFAAWQREGNDIIGAAADPGFEDAAKRDFRLKPDSPALKCGFKAFDFGVAGVR